MNDKQRETLAKVAYDAEQASMKIMLDDPDLPVEDWSEKFVETKAHYRRVAQAIVNAYELMSASVRTLEDTQSLPTKGGEDVTPHVIADIQARTERGIRKYGRPLQTGNGRSYEQDLYEELLDAVQYLKQGMLEQQHRKREQDEAYKRLDGYALARALYEVHHSQFNHGQAAEWDNLPAGSRVMWWTSADTIARMICEDIDSLRISCTAWKGLSERYAEEIERSREELRGAEQVASEYRRKHEYAANKAQDEFERAEATRFMASGWRRAAYKWRYQAPRYFSFADASLAALQHQALMTDYAWFKERYEGLKRDWNKQEEAFYSLYARNQKAIIRVNQAESALAEAQRALGAAHEQIGVLEEENGRISIELKDWQRADRGLTHEQLICATRELRERAERAEAELASAREVIRAAELYQQRGYAVENPLHYTRLEERLREYRERAWAHMGAVEEGPTFNCPGCGRKTHVVLNHASCLDCVGRE